MAKKIKKWVYTHFNEVMAVVLAAITVIALYWVFLWGMDHSPIMMKHYGEEVKAHWGE